MSPSRLGVWPSLPLDVYGRRSSASLPFPLEERGSKLFSRARHGLWQGVRALGIAPGDEVLAPAYHHGSEIEALVRAGIVPRFYEGTDRLEPDPGELESLLGPRVRALYLIHYLGFPQDAPRWRTWCDERGLLLLEDAAQAWLASHDGSPVGSLSDLSVFCLYKTIGVPDGAALLARVATPEADRRNGLGAVPLARRHAAWLVGRSGAPAILASRRNGGRPSVPAEEFHLGHARSRPSSATVLLLRRLADPTVAARRRANYEVLLEDLGERVPAPFTELPAGASPFAFPVDAENKAELLARLERAGIRALDFWSVPHPRVPSTGFPAAAARRKRAVALPVHQELRPRDLERMITAVRGTPPRRRPLRLEPLTALDEVRDEWSELAEASGNVFATWEWNSLWWRHFGAGRPLHATACRSSSGRLVAILPLYRWRARPLRIVRFLGHGPADQLGPICAPSDRIEAARALRRALTDGPARADLFLGEQLRGNEGWGALLGARVVHRTGNPILRFRASSWEEFLASRSANFRQQVRRRERKLRDDHDARFRLADDPARLEEDLDALFALHTARWGEEGSAFGGPGEAAHRSGGRETFHREFATAALERGWLRLWFLEVDGRPIATWYGFRFGGAESYYQAGRDPAWDPYSVGFLMLIHSMRAAVDDGVGEYRFLRGDEGYKYRFATEDEGLDTVALWRGAIAGGAVMAGALARRARRLNLALRAPLDQ